jgi:hypothetical protein
MDGVELSAVIANLRESLSKAQNDGEGKDLRFKIEDIKIELNVAVEDKGELGGGVKFYVLSAKADVTQTQTVTQKITLNMTVHDDKSTGANGETLISSPAGGRSQPPPKR